MAPQPSRNEHAVEVWPQQVGPLHRSLVRAEWRRRVVFSDAPAQSHCRWPPTFHPVSSGVTTGAVAKLAPAGRYRSARPGGRPDARRGTRPLELTRMSYCCRSRVAILPNDNPICLLRMTADATSAGAQLYGGGAEGVGGLQPMPTPAPAGRNPDRRRGRLEIRGRGTRGDRQFFLELGGHTGRAHSSAAIRTARRQRYVVTDVYPGWSAPAGRLPVLGTGSTAGALGFERDGLGEGSRLAITGASGCIELSFQAGCSASRAVRSAAAAARARARSLRVRASRARAPPASAGGASCSRRVGRIPRLSAPVQFCAPPDARDRRLPHRARRFDACPLVPTR